MNLKISRILHAGYVFECNQTLIVFDPIFENPFSRNCYAFPNVRFDQDQIKELQFSAVFISHFHDDHCSLESLHFLDRGTPIYVYCLFEQLFSLIRELGFLHVYPLEIDVPVVVNSFEVIPRKALDSDVDSIFQVKAAGLNILNVVDSWIDSSTLDELARCSPWDMILWPFQTMREIEVLAPSRADPAPPGLPMEWIEQLRILNPKYVVPSSCQFIHESWSWYQYAFFPISYRQFQNEIESALPDTRVIRLNPSVAVVLDKGSLKTAPPLNWIQPVGDQNLDYEYKRNFCPPTTSEISRQFAPVTPMQADRVFRYCRLDLLEKYRSMEAPTEPFFKKPRLWKLSVYDHTGRSTDFQYSIIGGRIELVSNKEESLSWFTEVPLAKFFAALECGESLTSMYMRINDIVFESDVEVEIQAADVVEDPLIRCLFTGTFGAYQIAQLKDLKLKIMDGRISSNKKSMGTGNLLSIQTKWIDIAK